MSNLLKIFHLVETRGRNFFFGGMLGIFSIVNVAASQTKSGPTSSGEILFEDPSSARELERVTDRGISEMVQLLKQFSDSDNRGEIWLRLAELYVEKAKLVEFRLQDKYNAKLDRWQKRRKGSRPKFDPAEAYSYNKKAARFYKKFVEAFPEDEKVGQALFFLGYNYFEIGEVKQGAEYYQRLTEEHPESPYVAESNFALGEFYFDRQEWPRALKYYLKVISLKSDRLSLFSKYKSAWCQYRMARYDKALRQMKAVYRESRKKKDQGNDSPGLRKYSPIRLLGESKNDLIPFYADSTKSYSKAYEFMEKVADGKSETRDLTQRLAYYYIDSGRKKEAQYIFRKLIAMDAYSAEAFDYQYQIVSSYSSTGDEKIFRQELERWIKEYGRKSRWYSRNSGDRKLVRDALSVQEATVRNFVLRLHQTAKNSRQKFSQNQALFAYKLYTDAFPDSEKGDLIRFYYAELLFDMKDFKRASEEYLQLTRKYPKSKYAELAAANAVLALEKRLPSESKMKDKLAGNLKPIPFSNSVTKFIEASETYLSRHPRGDKRIPFMFSNARLQYLHNKFDDAKRGFAKVVKESPKSKYGEYAANLLLDIYNLQKDYEGIQRVGRKILDVGVAGKVGGDIKSIVETSAFKTAQDLAKKKDFLGSARSYDQFVKKHPKSKLAVTALYNAALNYEKKGMVGEAIKRYEKLGRKYKDQDPKLSQEAISRTAMIYIQAGQYEQAQTQYERLVDIDPKKRVDHLYNSTLILDNLHLWTRAISNYNELIKIGPPSIKDESLFSIAEIWRKRGNVKRSIQAYDRYIKEMGPSGERYIEAHVQIARIYALKKELRNSAIWYKLAKSEVKKHSIKKEKEFIAESFFYVAESAYDSFRLISFPKDPKKQPAALKKKLKSISDFDQSMKEVAAVGEPKWAVAALSSIGKSNEHMNLFLLQAPVPAGLNEKQKLEYKKAIEGQADPFRTKAIKSYEEALQVIAKFKVFSKWNIGVRKALARVAPNRHRFSDFLVPAIGQVDWYGL